MENTKSFAEKWAEHDQEMSQPTGPRKTVHVPFSVQALRRVQAAALGLRCICCGGAAHETEMH